MISQGSAKDQQKIIKDHSGSPKDHQGSPKDYPRITQGSPKDIPGSTEDQQESTELKFILSFSSRLGVLFNKLNQGFKVSLTRVLSNLLAILVDVKSWESINSLSVA